MKVYTPADVSGDGVAHTLASLFGINSAKWVQGAAVSVGSTAARIGDSNVSTSRGIPIPAGGGQLLPPIAEISSFYDLTLLYYLVQTGDTVSLSCGV